ncbi:MAG: hypothetical protein A2Y10_02735 [Planctomycetes bacterium GWF2_41_51]|nr:MAG: hypothetical protein A2Y10_02735 [Planctomycetes bacterium GWF2_41_51]HBG27466.1 hypothetical protein [Phycisphaerales bacterium]
MKKIAGVLAFFAFVSFSIAGTYNGGTGEPDAPYKISSISNWQELMITDSDWNKHFILTDDVNLYGAAIVPVGNSTTKFTGTINGNSHIISNAVINTPTGDNVGLFGYAIGSSIININITSFSMTGRYSVGGLVGFHEGGTIENCNTAGQVYGEYPAGCVVGYNYGGLITNCSATGTANGPSISTLGGLVGENSSTGIIRDSSASVSVTSIGGQGGTGGLIGRNYGNVINCSAYGQVSGSTTVYKVGGLIGENYDSSAIVVRCHATGAVSGKSYVGGLIGINSGFISMCFADGMVTGYSSSTYIGGLVGDHYGNNNIFDSYATGAVSVGTTSNNVGGLIGVVVSGTIDNCYSTGLVTAGSGSYNIYGMIGYNGGTVTDSFWDKNTSNQQTSSGGTGKTTAEMKTCATFTAAGWDFCNETTNGTNDLWRMCGDGVNYPRLNFESLVGDFACPDGVGIEDLGAFCSKWLMMDCDASNNYCGGIDINKNNIVNFADFAVFAENWLAGL